MTELAEGLSTAGAVVESARRFHLCVVGTAWPPETFIARRLSSLAQRGHRVSVLSTQYFGNAKLAGVDAFDPNAWRAYARCVWPPALLQRPLKATLPVTARGRVFHQLRALRPDVVHFEWVSAAAAHLPLLRGLGAPVVVSCRGKQTNIWPFLPGQEHFAARLRQVFEAASAVHCVSEAMLEDALRLGMPAHKGHVITPAIDPTDFGPATETRSDGPIQIIGVGSLTWRKGYEYAIRAIQLLGLPKDSVRYTIVGGGEEIDRIRYTIEDCGLAGQVEVAGQLSPASVAERLRTADIFLHASLAEGLSNAVLEAMAVGIPVVCTDCGGMREAVHDQVSGFVVPIRDPEAMAKALLTLIQNPELRRRFAELGRRRVSEHFTLSAQTDKFERLYQTVLAHPLAEHEH